MKKREIVRRILFWVFLCVFVVAVLKLGHIAYVYWKNNRGYQDLRDQAQLSSTVQGSDPTKGTGSDVEVIIDQSGIGQEVLTKRFVRCDLRSPRICSRIYPGSGQ